MGRHIRPSANPGALAPAKPGEPILKRKTQSSSVFVLWTGGILICLVAVLLSLILSSCGTGDEVPITTPAAPTESAGGTGTVEPGSETGDPGSASTDPNTAAPTTTSVVLGETARRRAGLHRPPDLPRRQHHLRALVLQQRGPAAHRRARERAGLDPDQRHPGPIQLRHRHRALPDPRRP